jgi:hypothetical protein
MEVARPPFVLASLVTTAVILIASREPPRRASMVLRSETRLQNFGAVIAADGPRLALVDRSADNGIIVRIERVEAGQISTEARISIPSAWRMPAVDIRGETLAVHTDSSELIMFRRVRERWLQTQLLKLPAECRDVVFRDVHLGDRVLVVESRNVFCVLEQLAPNAPWALSTTLPRQPSAAIAVSRARIVVTTTEGAVQLERSRGGWRQTATFAVPHASVHHVAASERWLVLSDSSELYVFDLDAAGRKSAVITATKGHDIRTIAVGATTLVAVDDPFGLEWTFAGSWGAQTLLEGVGSKSGYHPIAIGDMIWIGAPELSDGHAGRVHGYELR